MSSPAIELMERSIKALRLEVPSEIADDVERCFHAVVREVGTACTCGGRIMAFEAACRAVCHGCRMDWMLYERIDGFTHFEHVVPEAHSKRDGYGTRYRCGATEIRKLEW